MFSRVPRCNIGWSERKLTVVVLCHGGIKAWEKNCCMQYSLRLFYCCYKSILLCSIIKKEEAQNEQDMVICCSCGIIRSWMGHRPETCQRLVRVGGTLVAILVSFILMIMASRTLPVGTVYAVFVGLGTAGTVLAEILLFGAEVQGSKLLLIGVLLLGVVGLKIQSKEKKQGKEVD